MTEARAGTGMVLGKFMPPHLGHLYLCEFAQRYVRELTVVVGSLAREPIPGALRFSWMRELLPDARVVHLEDELPQYPHEHPDFWALWQRALVRVLPPGPLDLVFASEPYGARLAEVLGARFVLVDQARGVIPVSGTAVREDPMSNWEYLPRCVRPYFTRRVCVFGPESTGKSTLAARLAARYRTALVPEYARALLEAQGGAISLPDIARIARGQLAAEDALARNARHVLVCDTDVLATTLWSDALFGQCPAWVRAAAEARTYDLYLLTGVDVPFVPDPVRYLPHAREAFFARCEAALEDRGRPFVRLQGGWDERFATACAAIEALGVPAPG